MILGTGLKFSFLLCHCQVILREGTGWRLGSRWKGKGKEHSLFCWLALPFNVTLHLVKTVNSSLQCFAFPEPASLCVAWLKLIYCAFQDISFSQATPLPCKSDPKCASVLLHMIKILAARGQTTEVWDAASRCSSSDYLWFHHQPCGTLPLEVWFSALGFPSLIYWAILFSSEDDWVQLNKASCLMFQAL